MGPDGPQTPDPGGKPLAKGEISPSPENSPSEAQQPGPSRPLSSAQAIALLDHVPGINVRVGAIIVAALGLAMDRFPDEAHLSSWVGLCPEASMSANKRLSTKTGKGNRGPRQALIEAANAAAREP